MIVSIHPTSFLTLSAGLATLSADATSQITGMTIFDEDIALVCGVFSSSAERLRATMMMELAPASA